MKISEPNELIYVKINLINKTFGSLTVLKLDRTEKYRQYWLCQCICGNTIVRNSDQLSSKGNKKHCGCQSKPMIHFSAGEVIGNLTILEETSYARTSGNQIGHKVRAWKCQCSCGNTAVVSTSALMRKNTTSCGCTRVGYDKDLTGMKTDTFEVLSRDPDKLSNKKYRYWSCLCKCGNKFSATTTGILQGQQKSCGCAQEEYFRQLRESKGLDPNVPILPLRTRKRNNSKHHKKTLIKKFGLACGTCKQVVQTSSALVMHHIVPVSTDMDKATDIENCILLCENCHILAHGGNWQTVDEVFAKRLAELKTNKQA